MRRPRVLIVDDNRANLLALEAVLEPHYDLVRAESGPDAIRQLEKNQDIDVILLDVLMPGMDGFEAAKHIKKIVGCADIPIIFVTAVYKEDPYVRKGYEVGGIDYFGKPIDPEILRTKVGIYASYRLKAAVLRERERQIRECEDLLELGRRLSSVLESPSVGVLITDTDGGICQATEDVARILKSADGLESVSCGQMLGWWDAHGRMLEGRAGPLARVLRQGETAPSRFVDVRCFDGSPKTIAISAAPLLGREHEILGAVILIRDVTLRKEVEKDLDERFTKLLSRGLEIEDARGAT